MDARFVEDPEWSAQFRASGTQTSHLLGRSCWSMAVGQLDSLSFRLDEYVTARRVQPATDALQWPASRRRPKSQAAGVRRDPSLAPGPPLLAHPSRMSTQTHGR
jgi:hypothetical protein